jgi:Txe/YoeB family toxin of toxin-antitoxin system
MRAPSPYVHFDSSHAIHDAMVDEAWTAFGEVLDGVLMIVRTVLHFVPTPENYRPAVRAGARTSRPGLKGRAQRLLDVITDDPFTPPPRFEKLVGDLAGRYSRRINFQHRLVYEVLPDRHVVHVLRMWTHYE